MYDFNLTTKNPVASLLGVAILHQPQTTDTNVCNDKNVDITQSTHTKHFCDNLMKRKLKQYWPTILLISTRRIIFTHLDSLNREKDHVV